MNPIVANHGIQGIKYPEIAGIMRESARHLRRLMVESIYHANLDMPRRGHYGSSTSSIEICLTEIVRLANPYHDFIAWKPHASPVVYGLLYLLGDLSLEDLKALRRKGSPCQAYMNHWLTPGVDVSTGCMGFPLPFCCGRAMGDKIEGRNRRVLVNLGDAEFTMPMGNESLRFAKINRLNNYGIIVDDNRQSMSGLTSHLMGERPLEDYFRFFGWNVLVVQNGHDLAELWETFADFERETQVSERPTAIVVKTDKWHGLPNPQDVGHHAHMNALNEETFKQYRKENGWEDLPLFTPPPAEVLEFFKDLGSQLKEEARENQAKASLIQVSFNGILPSPANHSRSPLAAIQDSFSHLIHIMEGRNSILYVDPDLGKFPGLLPNYSGPDSVEGEMYSLKNRDGFVIRAGLADPFAVAITAGLGKDGKNRYPIVPILDGFGLLVSESVKQGSLEGSHFLMLGIETNSWEGLTHQPGTSANTVFRNLPDRPKTQWTGEWEYGVWSYYPAHPREAKLIFEDCIKNRKLAYLKTISYVPPEELLAMFNEVTDEEFLSGGYVIGPRYAKPDLVILSCGRETYSALEAARQLRELYPEKKIQVSAINLLNLPISGKEADKKIMNQLTPAGVPLLRVTGLPLDTLGISRGDTEITLGTHYLTQSCTQEELAEDQGYDLASILKAGKKLLKVKD
jgi:transketolase